MKPFNLFKIFLSGEFIRFGMVGVVGFTVDFGSYFIMTRFLNLRKVFCYGAGGENSYWGTLAANASESCSEGHFPLITATLISVFLAILSNFFLNKFWTFRRTAQTGSAARQAMGYFSLNLTTYALNQILVGYFVANLGVLLVFPRMVDISAKVLAVCIILFINFFGSKFLVFRRKPALLKQN